MNDLNTNISFFMIASLKVCSLFPTKKSGNHNRRAPVAFCRFDLYAYSVFRSVLIGNAGNVGNVGNIKHFDALGFDLLYFFFIRRAVSDQMRDEADAGGGKVLFPSHFAAFRHYDARPVRPFQDQPVDSRFRQGIGRDPFSLMPPTPRKQIFAVTLEKVYKAKSPTSDFFFSYISPPDSTISAFEDGFRKIARPLFVMMVTFRSER